MKNNMTNEEELDELVEQLKQNVKENCDYVEAYSKRQNFGFDSQNFMQYVLRKNPDASLICTAEYWKEVYHREVKPDEKGVSVTSAASKTSAVLYDVTQTEGEPIPKKPLCISIGESRDMENYEYEKAIFALRKATSIPIMEDNLFHLHKKYPAEKPAGIVIDAHAADRIKLLQTCYGIARASLMNPSQGCKVKQSGKRLSKAEEEKLSVKAYSVAYLLCRHCGVDVGFDVFPTISMLKNTREYLENSWDSIRSCAALWMNQYDKCYVQSWRDYQESQPVNKRVPIREQARAALKKLEKRAKAETAHKLPRGKTEQDKAKNAESKGKGKKHTDPER